MERVMNAVVGIVSGLLVSLGMFASGAGLAVYLLAVEPVEAPSRQSDSDAQAAVEPDVVRLVTAVPRNTPARGPDDADPNRVAEAADDFPSVDVITTSAVAEDAVVTGEGTPVAAFPPEAHVAWCSERYRSYRPGDNTYRSFGGSYRHCVSPYAMGDEDTAYTVSTAAAELSDDRWAAEPVSGGAARHVVSDHASSCSSRYRSYRVEDNTYQPYGGGARRQCQ